MEHYFTNNPDLKSDIRLINYKYSDTEFVFYSDNGVFSKDKIDYASSLLVNSFIANHEQIKSNSKVLDIGCGYGFLGIVIGKIYNIEVDFSDVNKRALHLCKRNIKKNNIRGNIYESNGYENIFNKYDYIITNPPIRAGKETYLKILEEARKRLTKDGELWFVINKDQGAKSTKKALEEWYNIEVMEKSKGFFCFKAKIC